MNYLIKILTLVLTINVIQIFSQEIVIENNPYDIVNDYVKKKNSFNREKWFYEQRMYPFNELPPDAYSKAVDQRNEMRNNQGFAFSNAVTWTSIGPTSGFYFAYSNISGRVTTVKYDPINPSIIYIGAAYGGLWKSTNGGNNFSPVTDNEVSMSSGSVCVDPTNTNIIYYGTGEATYSGASYYGRGLLKSTRRRRNVDKLYHGTSFFIILLKNCDTSGISESDFCRNGYSRPV
jgi:hypothetical protein